MPTNCKKCGRKLTSKESIERGYGPTCFRSVNLQKPVVDTTNDISFLKMEISMLKRQINELKLSGVKHDVAINRINRDIAPISTWEGDMKVAIKKELKSIFSEPDWKSKILHSIDGLDEIREVPTK